MPRFFHTTILLILASTAPLWSAAAHAEAFLCIDGVAGDVTEPGYERCIEAIGLGEQFTRQSPVVSPEFEPLKVLKRVDKASPLLRLRLANGTLIPTTTLTLVQLCNGAKLPYYEIQLTTLRVSGVSATAGDAVPTEQLSFNYTTIRWTHTSYDENCAETETVQSGWDVMNNAPL